MDVEKIRPTIEDLIRRLLANAEELGIGGVQLTSIVIDDAGHARSVVAVLIGDRPEDTGAAIERMVRDFELRHRLLSLIDGQGGDK